MNEARRANRQVADEEQRVERVTAQLQRGLDRSKAVVAGYRRQLKRLAPLPPETERPLFRFGASGDGSDGC